MSYPGPQVTAASRPTHTAKTTRRVRESANLQETAKIRSKEVGGWVCKCRQGRTPQNFDRVLAAACLYRDMLSCQTHLSESAMMAQHSDVGGRRRLQKPYHHHVRAPTRWTLQEITRDHLVVASLCIGDGLHPAPAWLTRRGHAWDPHHTGITPRANTAKF
eukprot:COSAG05_NODE_1766_length_4119_cov_3.978856_5_plen_161_part_00